MRGGALTSRLSVLTSCLFVALLIPASRGCVLCAKLREVSACSAWALAGPDCAAFLAARASSLSTAAPSNTQQPALPFVPLAEAEHGARHHSDTAAFLQTATKDVYGASQGGASLADAVGRRAAFSDRRDAGAAFRRHG